MPGKTVMLLKWSKFALRLVAAAATGLVLQSTASFAQGAGATPIQGVLQWVIDLLEGSIARSIAVIAVCFLGFLAMTGRLSWQLAGSIIIGIALVFGAERLVDTIKAATGGGGI
ncbi:TrbC/VirB2 family protein [Brucella intermedia]|uniref:TrbC/VirB2 family protein n=1 Tax=Brucella intermedia TaxID=94625 RepID=UPI0023628BA8|nr:TrbC/VirB2 family protein [Brucella intermedia]